MSKDPPEAEDERFAPAVVVNKIDIGFLIKYELRFDDGVVSYAASPWNLCCLTCWPEVTAPHPCELASSWFMVVYPLPQWVYCLRGFTSASGVHAGNDSLGCLLPQIIEWHLKGEEDERPKAFDLQQRVYVALAPSHFLAFTPDEISSGPL